MGHQGDFEGLQERLRASGLRILHSGMPTADWPEPPHKIQSVLIIGHAGGEFWPYFSSSAEYKDGQPNPLDRWSARVIGAAAPGLAFASPNDGPPYPPIHALTRGGALHPSLLGMLVHSDFGLWTAVRGLLLCADPLPYSDTTQAPGAQDFADCIKACPVSAFSTAGYDAAACAQHLLHDRQAPCWQGCLVRKAYPPGAAYAYGPDQAKFYMDAFTAAFAANLQDTGS